MFIFPQLSYNLRTDKIGKFVDANTENCTLPYLKKKLASV